MIARSLVYNPKVIILDEPFNSLDIKSRIIVQNFIKKICLSGTTVLLVTHDINNILQQITQIVFIKNGTII